MTELENFLCTLVSVVLQDILDDIKLINPYRTNVENRVSS